MLSSSAAPSPSPPRSSSPRTAASSPDCWPGGGRGGGTTVPGQRQALGRTPDGLDIEALTSSKGLIRRQLGRTRDHFQHGRRKTPDLPPWSRRPQSAAEQQAQKKKPTLTLRQRLQLKEQLQRQQEEKEQELQKQEARDAAKKAFFAAYTKAVGRQVVTPIDIWEEKRQRRLEERRQRQDFNHYFLGYDQSQPASPRRHAHLADDVVEPSSGDGPMSPRARRRSSLKMRGASVGSTDRFGQRASHTFESLALSELDLDVEVESDGDFSSCSGEGSETEDPETSPDRRRSSGIAALGIGLQHHAHLRSFLEERDGMGLMAWLKHFDREGDLKVSRAEFDDGLLRMGSPGDARALALFEALDKDKDGYWTMEDVDRGQAIIWREFRHFLAEQFSSVAELLEHMLDSESKRSTKEQFASRIVAKGWDKGFELLLFGSLDISREGSLSEKHFRWFELEVQRTKLRETARKTLADLAAMRVSAKAASNTELKAFKQHLKSKYGSFLRAWRRALTPNDSLVIYKHHFVKACSKLGWASADPKALWLAFDQDESGEATLDELDFASARTLALFKRWIDECFGSSLAAFNAIDEDGSKTVKPDEFEKALSSLGFKIPKKDLFNGLDKDGKRFLIPEDIAFLDRWKPLPFLVANPNPEAAERVKEILLEQYKYLLSAWRQLLDNDGSNRCNWDEFSEAMATIQFDGDIAGAWRVLDADQAGYITLAAFDPAANEILQSFRRWADEEFGGVKPAFHVLDADGSGDITRAEFRQACRIFGFRGNPGRLFTSLDVNCSGALEIPQLSFLDAWEMSEDQLSPSAAEASFGASSISKPESISARRDSRSEAMMMHGSMSHRISSSGGGGGLSARRASTFSNFSNGSRRVSNAGSVLSHHHHQRDHHHANVSASMTTAASGHYPDAGTHNGQTEAAEEGRARSPTKDTQRGPCTAKQYARMTPPEQIVGALPRNQQRGLKAWNSSQNAWVHKSKGALPPISQLVGNLLEGLPPPSGKVVDPQLPTPRLVAQALKASSRHQQRFPPGVPAPVTAR